MVSAIEIIIQVSRYSDGSRRIGAISEVLGILPDGNYDVRHIFQMSRMTRRADGTLDGKLEPTGYIPSFMSEIIDNKLPFPQSKFNKAA